MGEGMGVVFLSPVFVPRGRDPQGMGEELAGGDVGESLGGLDS